jgi:hypothetical protein
MTMNQGQFAYNLVAVALCSTYFLQTLEKSLYREKGKNAATVCYRYWNARHNDGQSPLLCIGETAGVLW